MPVELLRPRGEASKLPPSPAADIVAGYKGKEAPLGGYTVVMGIYGLMLGGFLYAQHRSGRQTSRIGPGDLALLGIATHKVSRIIANDTVTSPIRAPFTEYKGNADAGEVNEKARGQGLQQATGQLLTCPWCMGAWVAALFTNAFALKPNPTRLVASIFAVESISDWLNLAYSKMKSLV